MGGTGAWIFVTSSTDDSSALGEGTPTALGNPDLDVGDPNTPVIEFGDAAGGTRSGGSAGFVAFAANGQGVSGQLSVLADEDAATCSAQGHLLLAG